MEIHPRIKNKNSKIRCNKIILGSFPTWTLSLPESTEKRSTRLHNGDFQYFYGSNGNMFWKWYKTFIDNNIIINNIDSLSSSLAYNSIGITDIIYSCQRKDKSALDKHLTKRVYNYGFLSYPESNQTLKILCTSKGVLNDMLFGKPFLNHHSDIKENVHYGVQKQSIMCSQMESNYRNLRKSIFRIFETSSGGKIECMSLPSPGSPYRRLVDFGLQKNDSNDQFLYRYLSVAFQWFMT